MSQVITDRLAGLNTAALNPLVSQALNDRSSAIAQWHYQPVYGGFGQGANHVDRIYRFRGTAHTAAGKRPWSLILKAIHEADGDNQPGAWNYWKREALLYQSGLLDSLAPGLVAPDCYGVVEQSGDEIWIWMEDVGEDAGEVTGALWPLERFALAAERLGYFNGSFLADRPLPVKPWLNQGDWQTRLMGGERYFDNLHAWRLHPLAQRLLPEESVEPLEQLWGKREQLFEVLDKAPHCFCHNDAFRRNLMLRRNAEGNTEVVAIDWALAGPSAVSEEAAKLLITSLVYLERPAADMRALYRVVLDGYLAGLRASGWTGDASVVHHAYAVASALIFLEHTWLDLQGLHSDFPIAMVERIFGHPIGDILDQQAALATFVLGVADELI